MPLPDALKSQLQALWAQATEIWQSGGWAMIPIAAIALVMFGLGMHVLLNLRKKSYQTVPERVWRRWIDHSEERSGKIGQLLDYVTGGRSLQDAAELFEQLRATETAAFELDLRAMKVCVGAAPLVGLLGTVTGMLTTFGALASGAGGDQTMQMVAGGISEALVTTETGLVVALPGLFFQYQLRRRCERYKAFLAHLETVCTQALYRQMRREHKRQARAAAAQEIAQALQSAVS